jgi:flagellar hook-basal body complex protein FliE
MDLRLNPNSLTRTLNDGTSRNTVTPDAVHGPQGFSDEFKAALRAVSQAQNYSNELQQQVQMENPQVSLEETMVAIQKAQIGFQATLQVRNRMVQAYTDIMNMSV